MPLNVLPAESYGEAPELLVKLVQYLNAISKVDPEAVAELVDHVVPVLADDVERAFPHLVLRDLSNGPMLSGLGLLGGFVNTDKYRLYAEFDDEDGSLIKFGICDVTPG